MALADVDRLVEKALAEPELQERILAIGERVVGAGGPTRPSVHGYRAEHEPFTPARSDVSGGQLPPALACCIDPPEPQGCRRRDRPADSELMATLAASS